MDMGEKKVLANNLAEILFGFQPLAKDLVELKEEREEAERRKEELERKIEEKIHLVNSPGTSIVFSYIITSELMKHGIDLSKPLEIGEFRICTKNKVPIREYRSTLYNIPQLIAVLQRKFEYNQQLVEGLEEIKDAYNILHGMSFLFVSSEGIKFDVDTYYKTEEFSLEYGGETVVVVKFENTFVSRDDGIVESQWNISNIKVENSILLHRDFSESIREFKEHLKKEIEKKRKTLKEFKKRMGEIEFLIEGW